MKKSYSLDGLIEMCGDDQAFIEEMQKVFVENNEKSNSSCAKLIRRGYDDSKKP